MPRQFGVSKDALSRHLKVHLPEELALAKRKRQDHEADELLADLRRLQVESLLILKDAKKDG